MKRFIHYSLQLADVPEYAGEQKEDGDIETKPAEDQQKTASPSAPVQSTLQLPFVVAQDFLRDVLGVRALLLCRVPFSL